MTENKRASPILLFIRGLLRREQEQPQNDTGTIDVAELIAILGGSDKAVTVTQALAIPDFSACINLIASTISTMPVQLYSETEGKTEPVSDERVLLLNDDTGDILNGVQFKSSLVRDYLIYGNGYAYIKRQGNRIVSLHYVPAVSVSVQKNTDPIFKDAVFLINGQRYEEYDFIKLCRNSKDGVTGTGLVAEQSELLTAQYKLLVFEKVLASSGGSKKGFLQTDKKLDEPSMALLRQRWKELYSSPDTNIMVLNNGLKYTDANQTSVEMQLCELMKDGAEKIYHACGVPSGLLSGTGTDEIWGMLYKTAVLPAQRAFEATLNRDLLLTSEKRRKYFAFDTKELLKGDTLKRYQAYEIALRAGFMQPDEVRYAEDLPSLSLGFVKLGLQDVLLNPRTGEIYTPNTNSFVKMGENQSGNGLQVADDGAIISTRDNPYHDPENGEFTSGPSGTVGSTSETPIGDNGNNVPTDNTTTTQAGSSQAASAQASDQTEPLATDIASEPGTAQPQKGSQETSVSKTDVSATGANIPCTGFEKGSLEYHFAKHSCEFPDLTAEQYERRAIELLSSPCEGDIVGYVTSKGKVVRFNTKTTEYATGFPGQNICTYMKPKCKKDGTINPEKAMWYYLKHKQEGE